MNQNDIVLEYIRSLFENENDKEIVELIWESDLEDMDDLLKMVLNVMEAVSD